MSSKIDWTDGVGAASLSNGMPVPLDRFFAWTPQDLPVGPEEEAVGTGQTYMFTFREDQTVSFEIRNIPNTSMSLMLRLQAHLMKGGQVSVTTGDSLGSVYPTCCRVKGTKPAITLSDPRELFYTFACVLLNVAGSPVRMIAQY